MTEIKTQRLTLRPYRPGEAALIHRLIGDQRVFFWRTEPGTRTEAEDRLASSLATMRDAGLGWWAVFLKGRAGDPAAFLGQAGLLTLPNTEFIEIGYQFVPEAWGRGYATEAARALLDHGYRALQSDPIVAIVLPENAPSLRVIQRLGLPYIDDQMHYGLVHRFFSLSREAYLNRYDAESEKS